MSEGIEDKIDEKKFTLPEFGIVMAIVAIIAAIAIPGMRKYWLKAEPKKEYVASYESPYVRQLADSALKKIGPVERSARLYEMDKDKDEVITEDEVLKYVRENYSRVR